MGAAHEAPLSREGFLEAFRRARVSGFVTWLFSYWLQKKKKNVKTLYYCGLKHARCVSTIFVLASLNSPPTMTAITWVQITRLVISCWGCYNSIYSSMVIDAFLQFGFVGFNGDYAIHHKYKLWEVRYIYWFYSKFIFLFVVITRIVSLANCYLWTWGKLEQSAGVLWLASQIWGRDSNGRLFQTKVSWAFPTNNVSFLFAYRRWDETKETIQRAD